MIRLLFSAMTFLVIACSPVVNGMQIDPGVGPSGPQSATVNPKLEGVDDKPAAATGEKTGTAAKTDCGANLAAVREASLQASAAHLQLDLEKLYKERNCAPTAAVSPAATANPGIASTPGKPSKSDNLRRIAREVLASNQSKTLVGLIAQNASTISQVNAAIDILNVLIKTESAPMDGRKSAAESAKFIGDPNNHDLFREAIMMEYAAMIENREIERMQQRQKVELEIANAKVKERAAVREREQLERELNRLP